jgi:hypothetical protein
MSTTWVFVLMFGERGACLRPVFCFCAYLLGAVVLLSWVITRLGISQVPERGLVVFSRPRSFVERGIGLMLAQSRADVPDSSAELAFMLLSIRTFLERDDERAYFKNSEPCRKQVANSIVTTNMPAEKVVSDELLVKGGEIFDGQELATYLAGQGEPFLDAYLPVPWNISIFKGSWSAQDAIGSSRRRDDKCESDPGKKLLLYNTDGYGELRRHSVLAKSDNPAQALVRSR